MRKLKNLLLIFFSALFVLSTCPTKAYGIWSTATITAGETASDVLTPTKQPAVAYYDSKYFASVESAVNSANATGQSKTVYVIPGLKDSSGNALEIKILNNLTINSSVTLCLPYTGTKFYNTSSGDDSWTNNSSTNFADSSTANVKTNRQTLVTIASNKTLTVNGKLQVGGVFGNKSQGMSTGTNGKYCEIGLYTNAKILINGSYEGYGYIKEYDALNNGSIFEIASSGSAKINMVFYDYKGGTHTSNIYQYCSPLQVFDVPNIQSLFRVRYGGVVTGCIRIYPSTTVEKDLTVVGPSSGVLMLSSGYLDLKYTPATKGITVKTVGGAHSTVTIHQGSLSLGYIYISYSAILATVEIDTRNLFLPLSYRYELFAVDSSIININYDVKFMPGSKMTIEDGSTLLVNKSLIFFDSTYSETSGEFWYPSGQARSELICNGSVIVSSTGKIGGYIGTTSSTGSFNVKNANSLTVTAPCRYRNSDGNVDVDHTQTAHGPIDSESTINNFSKSRYLSQGSYWTETNAYTSASISPASGATNANSAQTFSLTGSLSTNEGVTAVSYTWTLTGEGATLTPSGNGSTASLALTANSSTEQDVVVTVTLTIRGSDGQDYIATGTYTRTKKESGGGCLLPDTLVTMSDGTKKQIKDVQAGDMVLVMNHETGQLDVAPITFNDYEPEAWVTVYNAIFSDGTCVGVVYEHGFFDLDTMRYEYIAEDTYQNLIGHRFIKEDGSYVVLEDVVVERRFTEIYEATSFFHFNYYTEDLLSMPGGITGLFNIFEYGEDLKYNEEAKARDIETYGLFTYEDLAPLGVSEIMFEAYAGKYLKVALGKGILTEEYLEYLIERYAHFTE